MNTENTTELKPRSLSDGVQTYLQSDERTVLRPHQRTVFEDINKFFEEGGTRGYINLPTGTGKTVLFVELSQALLDIPPEQKKPKILVVTPSKDLVHQTMGKSGERGYGKFAPDLEVGSYFSDTPENEKVKSGFLENDVVVTTYESFRILSERDGYNYIPIERVEIPRVKIPSVKIPHVKVSKENLDGHNIGQFNDDLINSNFYQKMIVLYGEEEALERVRRWKSYPVVEDTGIFDSEIYKEMVRVFGEEVTISMLKQKDFYPVVDNTGIYDSEIYKRLVRSIGEKKAIKKIFSWTSYPIIEGSGLLESEVYKRILRSWGEEDTIDTIQRWDSYAVKTGRKLLDDFDIFLLDEAHHIFGETISKLVESVPQDKLIIGFTATPEADKFKKLKQHLPNKIHELGLTEAISLGLLAPILPIGARSGLRIEGSDIYDENGEYIDSKLFYLAQDENRNRIVINAAKTMAAENRGIIISCIAGGDAWHARHLAELLKREGLSAEAIYYAVPAPVRQKIYSKFNKGEIDVLTYIGVIGEGWDSERAKVIINARPTRSDIVAKQRLGRITRRNGQTAVAIDIVDDFDSKNPPVTIADVMEIGDTKFGSVIGSNEDNDLKEIVEGLKRSIPVQERLMAPYSDFKDILESLPQLKRGFVISGRGFPEYAIASRVSSHYRGLNPEIIEKIGSLNGIELNKSKAAQGRSIRDVYNIEQVRQLLSSVPRVDPDKYYLDEERNKWISLDGLRILFSKRFPDITKDRLEEITRQLQDDLDWIPVVKEVRTRDNRIFIVQKLFNASQESIKKISQAL